MKILHVNTFHFRGAGDSNSTFNTADLLREHGHTVAFFAMQDKRNLPDPNSDLFVSHIDFKELNRHKNVATGWRVLTRSIYSLEARHKFGAMLDRFKPDIVHLHSIHAYITPSIVFEARKRGLPLVWTLHDYKLICPNSTFQIDSTGEICEACGKSAYYQPILKRCKKDSLLVSCMASLEAYAHRLMRVREKVDTFLSPSTFLMGKLIERGFPRDKVQHLPHFLPKEMFQADDGNAGYLLFLGRLERIKGIHPLLEACQSVPEVNLILAGQAAEPLASELPALLPPNAQYVGFKHGVELQELVQNALAVVVPSLCYENQPNSILEAFACGKPVIASDLGGMMELVIPQERGLLVSPGDVEALAGAMRWMAMNPEKAREMGQTAQRYALDQHGSELHYQRLMGAYAQVMKNTGEKP